MNMASLRKNLRIYFKLQLMQIRSTIEYASDFWIGIVGAIMLQASGLVFISALFSQVPEVAGWTVWNIVLLYGLAMIPTGLRELFSDGFWMLRTRVNTGEFDRVLVRPVSPALQSATALVSIHGFGGVSLGIVLLVLGITRSDVVMHWWTVPYLLLVILSSAVMVASIAMAINLTGFWEPSAQSALPTMLGLLIDFAKFPLDIYNGVIRTVITVALPYAFVSYFPALLLLDRDTLWKWLGMATPLVAIWVVLATRFLWSKALNRYQGVGH
jgi:ABC-2 type transport system permease protein